MTEAVRASGHVTGLHVAATKGFAVRDVPSVMVESTGVVGNREFFVVDIDGRLYSVPKDPVFLGYWTSYDPESDQYVIGRGATPEVSAELGHPGESRLFDFDDRVVAGTWAPGPWDEWLSDLAGRRLRLARCLEPGGGYDVHPVTLQSTASLAALGTESDGRPIDSRRFRLNLTVDLGSQPFVEDRWDGRVIVVGGSSLRLRGGIPRCLAVEHRPWDADRSLRVQRRIRVVRGATPSSWGPSVLFGSYADVVEPGRVAVGDTVELAT